MGEPLNLLDKYMQKKIHSLYLQDTCIAWTFAYCVMELTVVPSLVSCPMKFPLYGCHAIYTMSLQRFNLSQIMRYIEICLCSLLPSLVS